MKQWSVSAAKSAAQHRSVSRDAAVAALTHSLRRVQRAALPLQSAALVNLTNGGQKQMESTHQ